MESIGLTIIFYIIGLIILYIVIETAVRNGINGSVVGRFINNQNGIKEEKESFLDSDLDNDK
jgi:hypothetical protein